jgi:glycosyltransferase involved in cell wall biosynthesis
MTIHRICIVGLDDYPVLARAQTGEHQQPTNGESVQHVLLARAWRDLGVQVSLVVYGSDRPLPQEVDDIRVIPAYRPNAGIPVLRFAYPRTTGLLAALRQADADVYYQSPSGMQTGITAWFCRRHARRFIYRVASDVNCIPGKQLIRHWRDRKLYEYGLKHADLLAVQTDYQRNLLRQNYGLSSEVVNMAVERTAEPPEHSHAPKDIDVLWVSNFRSVKRPESALQLAQQLPHLSFTLVGGPLAGAEGYYESIMARARELPNVTCLGGVPYSEVGRIFDRAHVLLNTSEVEGFPNTFLQAWIRGMPVVTFFDPDNLVRLRRLGKTVVSLDEAARALQSLLQDQTSRLAMGARARSFALTGFAADAVARQYLELLEGPSQLTLRDGTTG